MAGTNLDFRILLLLRTVVFKFMPSPLCTWKKGKGKVIPLQTRCGPEGG